jgi:hypothetical protein
VYKTQLVARLTHQGRRKKQNDESDVHFPQREKKAITYLLTLFVDVLSIVLLDFCIACPAFLNKGSSKTRKHLLPEKHRGSSKIIWPYFLFSVCLKRSKAPLALPLQGALKKKTTDAHVVAGWFLGGQKSTRAGQIFL